MSKIIKINNIEELPKNSYIFSAKWKVADLVKKCESLGLDTSVFYEINYDGKKYFAAIDKKEELEEDELDF